MRTKTALATITVITAITVGEATAASAAPPQTVVANDRAVSFTVDGTTAYGTVHVPAHRVGQRLAGALLLPGSGPTDRDGNQLPKVTPQTLKLIAGVLDQDGIVTFRFDKYFSGQTGGGKYANNVASFDLGAQMRQNDGAYDVLRTQPEVDPTELLVVGHSEGGLTALLTAESMSPAPAGLALLEPLDERGLDLVTLQLGEQLDNQVRAGQLTRQAAGAIKTAIRRVVADFRAGRPLDTTGLAMYAALFRAFFSPTGVGLYTRTEDAIYPPAVGARVKPGTRVLVTGGTEDTQVPCSTIGPLIGALAIARTRGPGLTILPGLDHFFHPAHTPLNEPILAPVFQRALHTFDRPWTTR